MFPSLAAEIDALDIALHGDSITAIFTLRDRLDAKLLTAVAAFEAAGIHEIEGSLTMAAWLRHQAGRDTTTAARLCTKSRKLAALPVLQAAFADGSLSGGQVETILAGLPKRHLDRFADGETDHIPP